MSLSFGDLSERGLAGLVFAYDSIWLEKSRQGGEKCARESWQKGRTFRGGKQKSAKVCTVVEGKQGPGSCRG